MKLIRYILFPVVPIYYVITWLRNKFYDLGWKSSTSYDIPIICVGNLSVGGTGKTPTVEYLIKLLSVSYKVATLSRGYKRKTTGFVMAEEDATAASIGDEPFQYFNKFKNIVVAVDTDRRRGISELIRQKQPDIIILDDAFQHRKVNAGFNILLTPFGDLYTDDLVLPTGNLREPKSGANRADVIIITKCPETISKSEQVFVINKLKPLPNQEVFFSSIIYSNNVLNKKHHLALSDLKHEEFTLVTGIANPKPLVGFLEREGLQFEHLKFKDHHNFSGQDILLLKSKRRIITTEKDYVRLCPYFEKEDKLFYLPIQLKIDPRELFEKRINNFLQT